MVIKSEVSSSRSSDTGSAPSAHLFRGHVIFIGDDPAPERPQALRDHLADRAVSDDPDGLVGKVVGIGVIAEPDDPAAAVGGEGASRDVPRLGDDHADRVIRDGRGDPAGGADDGHAALPGAGEVDVLHAASRHPDQLEALRGLDDPGADRHKIGDNDVRAGRLFKQLRRGRKPFGARRLSLQDILGPLVFIRSHGDLNDVHVNVIGGKAVQVLADVLFGNREVRDE